MDMKNRSFGEPWWGRRCKGDRVDSYSYLEPTSYTSSENTDLASLLYLIHPWNMTTLKVPPGHWGELGSFLTLPKCAGWKDDDLQWPGCQFFQKVLMAFDKRVSVDR